jgi:hypothetical protein
MTSPLCFSHFAIIVSSLTSSTNDKRVDHALGTVHEITKLCFPNWKQTWSGPTHTDFKAWS